jgi:hypothetical protein
MTGQFSVEMEDDVVVARVEGEPTEQLLAACQREVLRLVLDSGRGNVLYDATKMTAPPVDVPWAQRDLDEQLGPLRLRRAIVVPNSKLAFLARLAFGDSDYRVFYGDRGAAVRFLRDAAGS